MPDAPCGRWIDAVGEMEALCSLAGYAAETSGGSVPRSLYKRGPTFRWRVSWGIR